jgi:hypothetical protein
MTVSSFILSGEVSTADTFDLDLVLVFRDSLTALLLLPRDCEADFFGCSLAVSLVVTAAAVVFVITIDDLVAGRFLGDERVVSDESLAVVSAVFFTGAAGV